MANGSIIIVVIERKMTNPLKPCFTYATIDNMGNTSGNAIDTNITNKHIYIASNLFIIFTLIIE